MTLPDWTIEAITAVVAIAGGVWAMLKTAVRIREDIELRLDAIDREMSEIKSSTVTHTELAQAIKDIDDRNERFYQRMDSKIDSIKSDMMWLMQSLSKNHD